MSEEREAELHQLAAVCDVKIEVTPWLGGYKVQATDEGWNYAAPGRDWPRFLDSLGEFEAKHQLVRRLGLWKAPKVPLEAYLAVMPKPSNPAATPARINAIGDVLTTARHALGKLSPRDRSEIDRLKWGCVERVHQIDSGQA